MVVTTIFIVGGTDIAFTVIVSVYMIVTTIFIVRRTDITFTVIVFVDMVIAAAHFGFVRC